jgi:hypothetical protein
VADACGHAYKPVGSTKCLPGTGTTSFPIQKVSYSCNLLYDAPTAHLLTPRTRTTVDCPETKGEHFRRRFSDEAYKKHNPVSWQNYVSR